MNQKLELLSPSGDIDRLKLAVKFGADAVYVGGEMFGMRTNPSNFNADQLKEAVNIVHSAGKRLYLTCNTLPRNNELGALPDYLKYVAEIGVDALIIADMGVLSLAKKYAPDTEIHMSTQVGIVNYAAANALYDMGAKRIVTARELSLMKSKLFVTKQILIWKLRPLFMVQCVCRLAEDVFCRIIWWAEMPTEAIVLSLAGGNIILLRKLVRVSISRLIRTKTVLIFLTLVICV